MKVRAFAAAALTLLAVLLASAPALAHKPSDTYVTLELVGGRGHGRVDLAVRDLDHAIGLDEDGDGLVTWREVEARREAVAALVRRGLVVTAPGGPCPIAIDPARLALATHTDGPYVVVPVGLVCASEAAPSAIRYELFFDVDPQNRGLFRLDRGGASRTHVFTAAARELPLDEAPRGAPLAAQLAVLVREGVRHIWTGYDHVLFLLALLLPSVLRRERGGWAPVSALRPALADVLRVVSAFTVAHSMTLGLSAANVLTLPSRLVESAIAASVVLAAAENLRPTLREDRWVAAFALGLLHGFGFSSTLADLELPRQNLLVTLLGFNLGVELGQVAIVAVFVPLAYLARGTVAYRRGALVLGSAAILVVAARWFLERAFGA